jgi:choline-sulfatase
MIRTENYKYTHYLEGSGEELYDLRNDPGEMHNLATDPTDAPVLDLHRKLLREHTTKTSDEYFNLAWHAVTRWRSHPPGYRHHRGPAAPMD